MSAQLVLVVDCVDASIGVLARARAEERWHRADQRNAQQGETYSLTGDPGMFDVLEGLWEPPSQAEWLAGRCLRIGGAA